MAVKDHKYTRQDLYDHIGLTLQLAQDEIEEKFEEFAFSHPEKDMSEMVSLKIDGIEVKVEKGTSILDAAKTLNIHSRHFVTTRTCRLPATAGFAWWKLAGSKQLVASCATPVEEGMEILTNSLRVRIARKTMIELLLTEHNADCTKCYKNGKCELQALALNLRSSILHIIHLVA